MLRIFSSDEGCEQNNIWKSFISPTLVLKKKLLSELMIHGYNFSSNCQLSHANYLNIKIIYLPEAIKSNKIRVGSFTYIIKILIQRVHPISKRKNCIVYLLAKVFNAVFI